MAFQPRPAVRETNGGDRSCEWPGCPDDGDFRAPKSPNALREYRWFCLAHIRQYNASWNYYAGMSEAEVEAETRRDSVWRRPSWPFGGAARIDGSGAPLGDPFGLFGEARADGGERPARTAEERAMIVLDLNPPITTTAVKARYKELVKRHHPDANGGDKASEERFKQINSAYETIMNSLGA
jgi:DnaJ-domain-containing protein 1